MPTPSKPLTNGQLFGAFIVIVWAVTWWWVLDQTLRLRTVETSFIELKASLKAIEPYSISERQALHNLATTVVKQEASLQDTLKLMTDMNTMLQGLAKMQSDLKTNMDRLDFQMNYGYAKGKAPR